MNQIYERITRNTCRFCPKLKFGLKARNIRNIALAAAFLAAQEGGMVTMSHLTRAIRREYQKNGKVLMQKELEVSLSCGSFVHIVLNC
jgi:hypothetical protein